MLNEGLTLTHEGAIVKVFADEMNQRLGNIAMQVLGLYSQLEGGSKWVPLRGYFERLYRYNVGASIGGGTSELNRNAIATAGLGLPRG